MLLYLTWVLLVQYHLWESYIGDVALLIKIKDMMVRGDFNPMPYTSTNAYL